jgi:hypothetical protein
MLISLLNIIHIYEPQTFKQLGITYLACRGIYFSIHLTKFAHNVIDVVVAFIFTGLPPPPAKIGVLVHSNHEPNNYKDTKP